MPILFPNLCKQKQCPVPVNFFVKIEKLILKFIWKCKGLREAKRILRKKSEVGVFLDFRTYYTKTVIKTVRYSHWVDIEENEIDSRVQKLTHVSRVFWSAWVAQSVVHLTSAQVTICTDSSEPGPCFSFCVSLSLSLSLPLPSLCMCTLSLVLSLSKINK